MSKNEFLNKNVIITGASSGIGQAAAFYFLNCGAKVLLAGKDSETMKTLMKKNKFKNAIITAFDLTKDMGIYDFKATVAERLNKIDILVNCAGVQCDGDIEKTYPQDLDYIININLRAVFLLIKLLEKYFVQGASIINMSCLYGTKPMAGVISYAMSKAGLETLTRYAAADFAALGIRINAISACPVNTNSFGRVDADDEKDNFKEKMKNNIPLGRIARPDDIVKVIAFLASNRSEKITGQIIKVDGGRSLTSSGYVHYRGMQNMNSRFEPDGLNIKPWFKETFYKFYGSNKKMEKEIEDKDDLKEFVEENIKKSSFATRSSDAHNSVNPKYKSVDDNDEYLKQKFLKKTPNDIFDIKMKKQNKMVYSGDKFPEQIPKDKSNVFLNQPNIRYTQQEKNNNINNYDSYGYNNFSSNNFNSNSNKNNNYNSKGPNEGRGMLEKNYY